VFLKAVLIGLITWAAGGLWVLTLGWSIALGAPLMAGLIVGAILGDMPLALKAGATIQMAYIGYMAVGGAMPADIVLAGYLGVAVTVLAKAPPEMSVTFAMALGLLGLLARNGKMTLNSIWVHRADNYAERGDAQGVVRMNILASQVFPFFLYFVPAFLAVQFGQGRLEVVINALPEWSITVLKTIGSILPALGLAILLKFLFKKSLLPFLFIGFVLAAYLKVDILGVCIVGACLAALHVAYTYGPREKSGGVSSGT